jgi:glycine/D-amino acid oxidase-like deaminating enzyme
MSRSDRTDVVVVGGGAVGMAVVDALLAAGVRVTSVFPPVSDDRPVASRAAGAMLGAFGEITVDDGGDHDPAFRFRLEAQRLYPDWLAGVIDRSGRSIHQSRGTFVIANNVGLTDRASLLRMQARAVAVGERSEYVEPEDVPGLHPNQYQAPGLCLHLPDEHSVDADHLVDALVAGAATQPTWAHVPEVVDTVRAEGTGWATTTITGAVVRSDHVVVSAGSRSWEVLDKVQREAAGLPDLYFGKGVSCVVRGGPVLTSTIRTPNRSFACGIHVVPRSDGRLYLGATNSLGIDHDLERGIQPGELHNLFDELIHQVNTGLRETRIETLRVGFRPIVSHGRPIIGPTELPGLSVATGTYRDGVLMAPVIGTLIADGITGRRGLANPFPVTTVRSDGDPDALVDVGIRDIVSFLQEPRGELPYERAEQLRTYVTALFRMAVDDDGRHASLRDEIRRRLREAPINETMHGIFRDIADNCDTVGRRPSGRD